VGLFFCEHGFASRLFRVPTSKPPWGSQSRTSLPRLGQPRECGIERFQQRLLSLRPRTRVIPPPPPVIRSWSSTASVINPPSKLLRHAKDPPPPGPSVPLFNLLLLPGVPLRHPFPRLVVPADDQPFWGLRSETGYP